MIELKGWLKTMLKNMKLNNNLKKLVDSTQIEDIILFGSTVRGKEKPTDTDILILFKTKINKNLEYELRKELEKYYLNVMIISKTEKNFSDPAFYARESILLEGISLLSGKKICENYGLISLGMFKYTLKNFSSLQKTKFYYALNGRNGNRGVFDNIGGIKISDNLVLVSLNKIENMREFLDSWKIKYILVPILIPQRLNKKSILGLRS